MATTGTAIFFDAVGTLLVPDPPSAAVYASVGRRFGSGLSVDTIRTRFATAFANEEAVDFAAGLRTSEGRELRRWQTIVSAVLDDVTDANACFLELYEHFSWPQAWHCDPDAKVVLQTLAQRGYVLGMASNYDQRLRRVVRGIPALSCLRHLVISSEVGWRKPSPEFFAALAHSTDLGADKIIHVGDDRVNDYDGALAAGLRAMWYDPGEQDVTIQQRATHLTDLLPLVA